MKEVLLINGVFLAEGNPKKLLNIVEQLLAIKGIPTSTNLQLVKVEEYYKKTN